MSALHELEERKAQAKPEELRHLSALVHDLYEEVQARLKVQASSEELKHLLDHPVPLLQGERIVFVNLKDVERLYVDDDPIRRRFIEGLDECYVIPKRSHQSYSDLIQSLREILGKDKVFRVSECTINVQFTPLERGTLFLEYLRQQYSGQQIAEEIALLIVKGGIQATSPHEDMFRRTWNRIARTYVIRGTFDSNTQYQSCYDAQNAVGPALLVESRLRPYEIIGEMWQSVGPSYRDIWAAYAQALKDGKTNTFFEDRGASPADRIEVEVAIGRGFEQIIRRYQPVCLALWRRHNPSQTIDNFHDEWAKYARAADSVSAWLMWNNVNETIELAFHRDEPEGSLFLLNELKLTFRAWQEARSELGVEPYRFALTEQRYKLSQNAIVGHIMAWFAYLVIPRASGSRGPTINPDLADTVLKWVKMIRELPVPCDVAQEPLSNSVITSRVAADAFRLADEITGIGDQSLLIESLRELSKVAPTEITSIKLKDEPDKAATIYEVNNEETREHQAIIAVDAVLKIAAALALKNSLTLDTNAEAQRPLVALLSGLSRKFGDVLCCIRQPRR